MGRVSEVATALRRSRFISFDGAVSMSSLHQRPDRYRHLEADLGREKRIARGAGLSYSAASFGEGIIVQEMSSFNRVLALDRDQRTVRVEAGLTVGDLHARLEGIVVGDEALDAVFQQLLFRSQIEIHVS